MAGTKPGPASKKEKLDLKQVEALAKRGWTDAEMSQFFGVDIATWYRWKASNAAFAAALRDWKAEADSRVERGLYERAIGYSHPEDKIFNVNGTPLVVPTTKHYPPDTVACIFWLKNRDRENWRDKIEHAHTGANGGPVQVEDMTPLETARRVAFILAQGLQQADQEDQADEPTPGA